MPVLFLKAPALAIDISEFGDFSSRSTLLNTQKNTITQEEKELLLSKKLIPNTQCLLEQIKNHKNDNVELLLKSKVNPNEKYMAEYPIHIAAKANNFEAVKLLYEYGAKLDKGFYSELYEAINNKNKEMAQYLLDRNANIHYIDLITEKTILYLSLKNNMYDISQQLINKGAKPDKKSIMLIKKKKLLYLIKDKI